MKEYKKTDACMDVYFFVFSLDQSTKNVNLKAKEENDKYAKLQTLMTHTVSSTSIRSI